MNTSLFCRTRLAIAVCALLTSLSTLAQTSATLAPEPDPGWWQHAVIYEIYPRSFLDTKGSGTGDIKGITQKLDYLSQLGVDALWIAPMYPSPQIDFGYDIANYRGVDPQYGTQADMDALLAQAQQRHLHVILDMVLNHTSDQHPWFVESASSRTNARADWFVWNDGLPASTPKLSITQRKAEHEGRVPPNNWTSLFGGSAWQWVPARHQFYYHRFYPQQPDLNWRNPAVESAMFAEMRYWLDRGVGGFRLDAITALFEDPTLANAQETGGNNPFGDPNLSDAPIDNLPEVHGVMQRLRAMLDSYPTHPVLIGETWLPRIQDLDLWYGGAAHNELNLAMDMRVAMRDEAQLRAPYLRRVLTEERDGLHGSPPLRVFDNHDKPRSFDRLGDGSHNVAIARAVAAILYLTPGSALTYYGAELGMPTTPPTRREDVKDPIGLSGWPLEKGRDGERTPMQWTPGYQAGFTTSAQPWLPVPANYKQINVQTQDGDPDSLLNWTRLLLRLRHNKPALTQGDIAFIDHNDPDMLTFVRQTVDGGDTAPVMVAINLSAQAHPFAVPDGVLGDAAPVLLAVSPDVPAAKVPGHWTLPPYGVVVIGGLPSQR